MMRKALTLTLVVVGAIAASPQVAAAETRRACEPRGSEVVLENTEARIYFVHKGTAYRAYACSNRRRNPRHHLLARWRGCECTAPEDFEPQVWLAGEVVAWNQVYCDPNGESCTGYTTSMRVTSGRPLRTADTGPIMELALKPNGSFAYLRFVRNDLSTPADDVFEVHKTDEQGAALLDAGRGIDMGSLAQAGSRLYWLNDGQPRTAILN